MKDRVHALADLGADGGVGKITFPKLHRFESSQVFPFAGDETIDAAHCFAPRQQRGGNRTSNKTGNSGNQVSSQIPPLELREFEIRAKVRILAAAAVENVPCITDGAGQAFTIKGMAMALGTTVAELKQRIETRQARIGIVGMGYVGLPLALLFSDKRFHVTGFDIASDKVSTLN